MPLTQSQINQIRQLGATKGYGEDKINVAIAKAMKNYATTQESQQLNVPSASQVNTKQPINQSQATDSVAQSSFVGSFFKTLYTTVTDPIRKSAGFGTDLVLRNESLGGGEEMRKKNPFLSDTEVSQLDTAGGAAIQQAKNIAGIGSMVVPVGAGVKGAAVAGAAAGGLQALGSSESGNELEDTLKGAATGAVVGGALAGIGDAVNAIRSSRANSTVGKKIAEMGTEFKKSAYVKAVGRKPIVREGGDRLLDKMMKAGIKPGNPEEIIHQADDILIDNAGVIFSKADEFAQKGVTINKQKILAPLQQKLSSAPAKSKPVIQKVIDFVQQDLDGLDRFTPAEAYALKGDYGAFGNWNSTMDADAITEANLWEDIYVNLNSLMDDSFKKGGYDEFRKVNDVVSTAINAKKYASRAGNVAPNLNTLGLMDMLSAGLGGSVAGGGLPGAVGGVVIKRAANSSTIANAAGELLTSVGGKLSTGSGESRNLAVNPILRRLAERGAVGLSTSVNSIENPTNKNDNTNNQSTFEKTNDQNNAPTQNNGQIIPQVDENAAKPFGGRSKNELLQLAIADGATLKDLKEIGDIYDLIAPQDEDVDKLLTRRKSLADAGLSTSSIDAQLTELGFAPTGKSETKELSAMTENRVQLATSGLRALNEIEQLMEDDPLKMFKNALPGKLGARDYDSAAFRAVEGLLRARSGAAIPETEVRRYMSANLPKIGDSQEEIVSKMSAFRKDLEDIAYSSGSFSVEDALGN